jgi:tetratricopeptide (TPR) repeat protein
MVRATLILVLASAAPARGADPPAVEQGIRRFDEGRFAEARDALLPAASAKPPEARAAFYLGRIALRASEYKEAARWFETAVERDPQSSPYHYWLGRAYGAQAQRANKLSQAFLAKKTKAEFDRAVTLDPGNLDARNGLAAYYLQAPGFLGGSVEKASEQAEEIRKRDPLRGTLLLGSIAEHEKDVAGAERQYLAAARAYPDSLGPRYALGMFYQRAEKYDQAFATFEAILAAKPDETNALYQVGRTGALSGQRLERAEQALRQFIAAPPGANAPNPAGAHWRLGMVYEKGGKQDLARAAYRRSLEIDPEFADAKKSLAKLK